MFGDLGPEWVRYRRQDSVLDKSVVERKLFGEHRRRDCGIPRDLSKELLHQRVVADRVRGLLELYLL